MTAATEPAPRRRGVAPAREALSAAVDALTAAGCDSPRLDAELLIADAMGVERADLVVDPERAMAGPAARLAMERVRRRVRREPVAYILGRSGFRHIELAVDRRVLIPRPETELLVELAVGLAPSAGRVHDVGTGSGAVALAVKHERPDLVVSGSDASPAAVEVARANARRLALDVPFSVARDLPARGADLVTANLPYVREDEWPALAPEIVGYEPREALVGGVDGLDAVRALASHAPGGTLLVLEHAPSQASAVRELLRDAVTHRDLAGRERATAGRVP